jgi:hypothetical protein
MNLLKKNPFHPFLTLKEKTPPIPVEHIKIKNPNPLSLATQQ